MLALIDTLARLIGPPAAGAFFALLLIWGLFLLLGIRVRRQPLRFIGVILLCFSLSMLLGLMQSDLSLGARSPGGAFGNWVNVNINLAGFSVVASILVWIAAITSVLLATDWLFIEYITSALGIAPPPNVQLATAGPVAAVKEAPAAARSEAVSAPRPMTRPRPVSTPAQAPVEPMPVEEPIPVEPSPEPIAETPEETITESVEIDEESAHEPETESNESADSRGIPFVEEEATQQRLPTEQWWVAPTYAKTSPPQQEAATETAETTEEPDEPATRSGEIEEAIEAMVEETAARIESPPEEAEHDTEEAADPLPEPEAEAPAEEVIVAETVDTVVEEEEPPAEPEEPAATLEIDPANFMAESENPLVLAALLTLEYNEVSISLLQKRLSVGYSQAAQWVDRLVAEGILSPEVMDGKRKALLSQQELLQIIESDALQVEESKRI